MYQRVEEAQALEVVKLAREDVVRGDGADGGLSSWSSSLSSSSEEGGKGEFSVVGVPPVMVLTVPSSCMSGGLLGEEIRGHISGRM